ncbi:MAG: hypothetical protein ACYDBY_03510 [Thermoanaerobaculia bacterium]
MTEPVRLRQHEGEQVPDQGALRVIQQDVRVLLARGRPFPRLETSCAVHDRSTPQLGALTCDRRGITMATRIMSRTKGVLVVLVSAFFLQTPSQLDAAVSAKDKRLQGLLSWAEQLYLVPNGASLKSIDPARSAHLENLAIMLGLVLRPQIGYARNTQSLVDDLKDLQGRTMLFLAETAKRSGHLDDPERFWRDYAVEAIEGKCDDYARRVFKVDPDAVSVPSLLAPSGVNRGSLVDAGSADAGAAAPSGSAAGNDVALLGESAPENLIDPYPRSSPHPQALEADSIVGVWSDFSDRGAQLELHKAGEGRYEGRLLSEGNRKMRTAGGWRSFRFLVRFESFNTGSHLNMGSWNHAMYQMEMVYSDYERPPSMIDVHNRKMPSVVEKRARVPVKLSILNGQLFMRISDGISLSASHPPYQWKK